MHGVLGSGNSFSVAQLQVYFSSVRVRPARASILVGIVENQSVGSRVFCFAHVAINV